MTIALPKLHYGDRAFFQGRPVAQIVMFEKEGDTPEYFQILFDYPNGETGSQLASPDELRHLIDSERLKIDWASDNARVLAEMDLFGRRSINSRAARRRLAALRKGYLASLVLMFHTERAMPLTIDGLEKHLEAIGAMDRERERLLNYDTTASRPSQMLPCLPSSYTLLKYLRQLKGENDDVVCFAGDRVPACERDDLAAHYEAAVLGTITETIREGRHASFRQVAIATRAKIKEFNAAQVASDVLFPITVLSECTYARKIKENIDQFWADCMKFGLGEAANLHGFNDGGIQINYPGERVEFDTWTIHVITLDVTRAAFLAMTVEERAKVPRVRRLVVIAIDAATRCILGFCICKTATQDAALEALRMTAMDKTRYFEAVGIKDSKWDHKCGIVSVVHDNGNEFGRNPFIDSRFKFATNLISSSAVATVAGAPKLRSRIERFNWTADAYFARFCPGWTAESASALRGRNPTLEACLTDDDLLEAFIAFVAMYHRTPHRMLGMSPDDKWRELTSQKAYEERIPSPEKLRNATGQHTTARISNDGINIDGAIYINENVRSGLYGLKGTQIELVFDRFNMGAISVLRKGVLETVPALHPEMINLHRSDWRAMQATKRAKARIRAEEGANARHEARNVMLEIIRRPAKVMDISLSGPTDDVIERTRVEMGFGKGRNERPFISELDEAPLSDVFANEDTADDDDNGMPVEHPDVSESQGSLGSVVQASSSDAQKKPSSKNSKLKPGTRAWRAAPNSLRKS